MRIPTELLNVMFDRCGVDKNKLHRSLIIMGKDNLTKDYRDTWSIDNPTRGYCYNVSEFVFHYFRDEVRGFHPYVLGGIPNEPGNHRYLMNDEGLVIDLTGDQFSNWEQINYDQGKKNMFFHIKGGGPSKRTKILADLYFGQ